MPDPHEQQIARADAHMLRILGPGEVVGGYVVAGLEPRQPAQPRNVEQDTAAGNPVARHLDSTGAASVAVRPSLTSLIAASRRSWVMLFSAPRRSAAPHTEARRNRWYRALNSAAFKTGDRAAPSGLVTEPGCLLVTR